MSLYLVNSPSSNNLIWAVGIGSTQYSNFLFLKDPTGYFLAFSNNTLSVFRENDGSVRSTTSSIPVGKLSWSYPFNDHEVRLVSLINQTVSIYHLDVAIGVGSEGDYLSLPAEFSLSQNFPNPFNPVTRIEFSLPQASYVTIEVLNLLGQKIKILVNERLAAGHHVTLWDGTNGNGEAVSSGVYFYRITAEGY